MLTTQFVAVDFIAAFRAAGGTIGIHEDRVFQSFAREHGGAERVVHSYVDQMNADHECEQEIRQALEDEVVSLSPDELARLHKY